MEWLGYCWHQSSTSTCSVPVMTLPLAVSRERRPLTTQPSVVGPGGVGQRVAPGGRGAADRRVVRVEHVDVGRRREARVERQAEQAAVPVVVDLVRRSAKTVGVVSVRLSNTLMMPLFSATKTRPSGAKCTEVGFVRPLMAVDSKKPGAARASSVAPAEVPTGCANAGPAPSVGACKPASAATAVADDQPTKAATRLSTSHARAHARRRRGRSGPGR